MSEFIFLDKKNIPTEKEVSKVLGDTSGLWENIIVHLKEKQYAVIEEWKYYSSKSGWTKKVLLKKRNLFFFKPYKGFFKISFVFGDKAVNEINKIALPDEVKNNLNSAKKYAEGRGISIEVRKKADLDVIFALLDAKIRF